MVGIYNNRRIRKRFFGIKLAKANQILVVVVGDALAVLADRSPEDRMGQRIPVGGHLHGAVDEIMAVLGRINGV